MRAKYKVLGILLIYLHALSCFAYAEDSAPAPATNPAQPTNGQGSAALMPVEQPYAAANLSSQPPITYGPVITTSAQSDDSSGLPPGYNYGDDSSFNPVVYPMYGDDTDPSGLGGDAVSFGNPDDSLYSPTTPQADMLFAQQIAAPKPKPASTKVPVIDSKGKKTGAWIDESQISKGVTINGQPIEVNPTSPKPGQTYLVRTLDGYRLCTQPVTVLDADGKKIGTIVKVGNDGSCTIKFSDGTLVTLPLGTNKPGKPYLVPVTDKDGKVIGYRVNRNTVPKTPPVPTK